MRILRPSIALAVILCALALPIAAQQPDVPQVFRYTYTLPESQRVSAGMTLDSTVRIYSNDLGGSPIWLERFRLVPDLNWRLSIYLGSTTGGLPPSIFQSNAARWISVQIEGFEESPRAALISVPYALKARDADTLGGLPASAYLVNLARLGTASDNNSRTTTTGTTTYQYLTPGAQNLVPKFINSTDLGGSQITDTGLGVGIGVSNPQEMFDVNGRTLLRSTSRGPAGLWLGTNDSSSAFIGLSASDPASSLVLSHGGFPRITLTQAGQVGIGVDAPISALHVKGDIRLSSGALYFPDGTSLSTAPVIGVGSTAIAAGDSSITVGTSNATTTVAVADLGVTSTKIADLSVTTAKIADGSVTAAKLAPGAITVSGFAGLAQNSFTGEQTVQINNPNTSGISSYNSSAAGPSVAIFGETSSTTGLAIRAHSAATTGKATALHATAESTTGYGTYSVANATTGNNYGVYGVSRSSGGTGVMGDALATTGTTYGVYGQTAAGNYSAGVYGVASNANATDTNYGVYGKANGIYGIGVIGSATNTAISNGAPIGVLGSTISPLGVGGQFISSANTGNVIVAQNLNGNVWRVDTSGNEYLKGTVHTGGADFAESIQPAKGATPLEPGDVLVIADTGDRQVQLSNEPYSTRVIGVYATKPGLLASRQGLENSGSEVPVAMVGIVPAKASTENGPIRRGDLLVSASIAGHVMRATDRERFTGAIVGKAMQELQSGRGVIEIAVTLQ
jgi:hypothetical protein